MEQRVIVKVQNTMDNIARIKMQLIINKDLYNGSYIKEEEYRSIEDKLVDKLHKLENLICIDCEA